MPESPIEQLLLAVDALDVEAVTALMSPECRILTADGRRASGIEAVGELLREFLAELRAATHRLTAQWHVDDVWIAEADATYELRDWLQTPPLPRAVIVRTGPQGITDVHAYGAHERDLMDHAAGDPGMRIGGRWLPPL